MSFSYGNVTWWGFSPALDLLELINKNGNIQQTEINILLVGSADGRHIIQTLMSLSDEQYSTKQVNFYVEESCLEAIARQILLLNLLLQQNLSIQEKTEMFLEIYGNSLIRKDTSMYLSEQCNEFIRMITEPSHASLNYPLFDFSNLKYKELDKLEEIFSFWCRKDNIDFNVRTQWDNRLRQNLGARYDGRENVFDWDYNMSLKEKAPIVNWREYKHWRETGIAFQSRDVTAYEIQNRTLASTLNAKKNGEKISSCGYWGDILVGPYIGFGIKSRDQSLFEKKNGVYMSTSTNVSYSNILSISKLLNDNSEDDLIGAKAEECIKWKNTKIVFLSTESIQKMHKRSKYVGAFDLILFSNSMVHELAENINMLFRGKDSLLVVESSKYMLDLNSNLHKEYGKKIVNMGEQAHCKVETTFVAEDHDYAIFKFQGC